MSSMSKKLLDTSTSLLNEDDSLNKERQIESVARQKLRGRLFKGIFYEKRYVETLNAYRDVISICNDEKDLIEDLVLLQNKIRNEYSKNHWIGITTPDMQAAPSKYCIWVELPQDQAFGCYWFKIKSVTFNSKRDFLRVQVLRSVSTPRDNTTHSEEQNLINEDALDFNLTEIKGQLINNFRYFLNNIVTAHNIKEAVIFISVMLVTALTGSVELLKVLCEFLLRFMRETSNFIQTIAPILIACINMIGMSIIGFYKLIAFLWKDGGKPAPIYNLYSTKSHNSLSYGQRPVHYQRALPSTRNSRGVVITEIS